VFGATVEVQDQNGETAAWQIVGEDEADIKESRISVSSPIARALIGKEPGETVEVQTPGGVKRYEIVDVRYE
jgi:transcription elongation factor GreA